MLFIIAIAPTVALFLFFYHKDKYEKEPLTLLLKAFLAGMVTIIPILIVERILLTLILPLPIFMLRIFLIAFMVAGLVEEGFKFLAFRYLIYNHNEFDEPYDGIMYGVMISLGFATLENINYLMLAKFKLGAFGMMNVGIMRAIFAVPAHAFFGVIMGYYLGLARFARNPAQEKEHLYRALSFAILAHGLYDFFIFTYSPLGFFCMLILFFTCLKFCLKATRIHVENSPFKNKGNGDHNGEKGEDTA